MDIDSLGICWFDKLKIQVCFGSLAYSYFSITKDENYLNNHILQVCL